MGTKTSSGPRRPGFDVLSTREREVVGWLAEGSNTVAIGKSMAISHRTVSAHIQNVLRKLGMNSRVELVVHAYKTGFIR